MVHLFTLKYCDLKLTSERVMVGAATVKELVRVLQVIVGWRTPHVGVTIAVILLVSEPSYRLQLLE